MTSILTEIKIVVGLRRERRQTGHLPGAPGGPEPLLGVRGPEHEEEPKGDSQEHVEGRVGAAHKQPGLVAGRHQRGERRACKERPSDGAADPGGQHGAHGADPLAGEAEPQRRLPRFVIVAPPRFSPGGPWTDKQTEHAHVSLHRSVVSVSVRGTLGPRRN